MWKLKSSRSPIAAIGEANASDEQRDPEREQQRPARAGSGVPRRRSVRARSA